MPTVLPLSCRILAAIQALLNAHAGDLLFSMIRLEFSLIMLNRTAQ